VLAGDSAGGGLGLALRLRDAGLSLPSRLILFSFCLDLTLALPAGREVEPQNAMLGIEALRRAGALWANGADLATPCLSPFHADMEGMPPIHIFQGSHDLLAPDSRSFADRARAAGHPTD
jgi:monoterpene epsilon-lactone hydrolase